MGSFTDSLLLNIERVQKEVDAKCETIFQELAVTVIARTPILRGNLVNDFWPAINSYSTTVMTVVDSEGNSDFQVHSDVTGSGSLSRSIDVLGKGTFRGKDGFLSFSTSVPYAHRIEYEGWSQNKAPAGFMRVSIAVVAAKHR